MTFRTLFAQAVLLASLLIGAAGCQPTPEERFARAVELVAVADYRTAAIELRNVLQTTPDDARARMMLAEISYHLGDLATSVRQYERALRLGQNDSGVWVGYGRALLSQGRAQDVIDRVFPALDAVREDDAVAVLFGDVFFAIAKFDEADSHYLMAIAANPSSIRGLMGRTMVLAARGEYDRAQEILDDAAKIYPQSSLLWMVQGDVHRLDRQLENAASAYKMSAQFETAETPATERYSTRTYLASSLIDLGRLQDATIWLADLQTKFPNDPASGFLRARLAYEGGDYTTAQLEIQNYLSSNPDDLLGRAILDAINSSVDKSRHVDASVGVDTAGVPLTESRFDLTDPSAALTLLLQGAGSNRPDEINAAMLEAAQDSADRLENAIRHFEQRIAIEPSDAVAKLALANAYLIANQNGSAFRVLDTMIEGEGRILRRQTLLIIALAREGDRARAIEESEKLIVRAPDDPSSYVVAGALWQALGDDDNATDYYRHALSIDTSNLVAQYGLSSMALLAEEWDEARAGFTKLLETHRSFIPGILSLGLTMQNVEGSADLRPYLDEAIAAAPDVVTPYVILARLELTLGRPDAVIELVDAAKERFPNEPEFDSLRGLSLFAKGEYEAAVRSLSVAVVKSPSHVPYSLDLGKVQLAIGQFDAAFETARALVVTSSHDSRGIALLVEAAITAGDAERAREHVLRFVQFNPDNPDGLILLGDIEMASSSFAAAAKYYEAASAKAWSRAVAIRLSHVYIMIVPERASDPLNEWLTDHPKDAEARNVYAQVLESQGRIKAAKTEYESLLEEGQLNAIGKNNLAWQYFLVDDTSALRLAEEAHDSAPDNASIADTLGWILAEQGEIDRALPLVREAALQSPENPEIQFHHASILARSGDRESAATILDELLQSQLVFPSRSNAQQLAESL